jgi:hypothetical protein
MYSKIVVIASALVLKSVRYTSSVLIALTAVRLEQIAQVGGSRSRFPHYSVYKPAIDLRRCSDGGFASGCFFFDLIVCGHAARDVNRHHAENIRTQ